MGIRTRAGIGTLAAVLATVLAAGTASAVPEPGAPGAGDPYYPTAGNGGYNVDHYDLRLTYQPATDALSGTATILAKTTQDLSRFNLDLGLDVHSVRVNNAVAAYEKGNPDFSELIVTPAKPVLKGRQLLVVVQYSGIPGDLIIDGQKRWWRSTTGGHSVNQPKTAEWWYPANDHPSDKATYDISVEVPDGTSALSNGELTGKTVQRPGWTRWHWRSADPMAPYLAFIAMGKFEVHEQTTPDGMPFITAYDPDLGDKLPIAKANIERTPEVTDFLETKFGPYPFDVMGGVAATGKGLNNATFTFAIETQTRPVYGTFFWDTPEASWVVAHEQAHQWFGDSVSLKSWPNMWLNEGFASYAEWLWSEHEGRGTAAELAESFYRKYPAGDAFWQVVVSDPKSIFATPVYERGAMALHALRTKVGDEKFFAILRGWHDKKKGGNATIAEFTTYAEQQAGTDLDPLFKTWLHDPVRPPTSPNGTPADASNTAAAPESFAALSALHEQLAHSGHGH